MFGISDYGAFVLAFIVLLFIPGPGNLAIILSTTQGGLKGGVAATLGLMLGDQVLLWLAVAGVAAVLSATPTAFHAVQWLGALYLAWLGFKMWLTKPGAAPVLQIRPHHFFRQTMAITVLNPKAIVFYMAFLPLFIDPLAHRGMLTFGVMAVTVAVLAFVYCFGVVLLTYFLAERMRANPRVSMALNKLAGLCLIGFGIKLALSR